MSGSEENIGIRGTVFDFEKRIDEMHLEFQRYHLGEQETMPDWERLEMDIIAFSRRKIPDLQLATHLDRVMYKFQNRKKIWLKWVEEFHHIIN